MTESDDLQDLVELIDRRDGWYLRFLCKQGLALLDRGEQLQAHRWFVGVVNLLLRRLRQHVGR